MMKKNLLVITDGFSDKSKYRCHFVKEYVNLVKDNFNNIYVISPQPYLPSFLLKFKIFSYYNSITNFIDYEYDNVRVYYPSFLTLPFNFFSKYNGNLFYRKIKEIIKIDNLKFDIMHSHFIDTSGFAGFLLKKENIFNMFVLHIHESPIENITKSFGKKRVKYLSILKESDKIITVGKKNEKEINNFYKYNKKTILLNNFVNSDRFFIKDKKLLRKKYGFSLNDKILLNVGNIFFAHKGQDKLINIIKDLIIGDPNIKLILIGDGIDRVKLEKNISSFNLTDKVIYLGSKTNYELIDYYNLADIFVFPSYHESFGIVQIEAMACGLPVIAFKNGGSEDIIVDEKLGFLINKIDFGLFKSKIILGLKKSYNKRYIRDYVIKKFGHKIIKEKLLNLYFDK